MSRGDRLEGSRARVSAGILLYRRAGSNIEVLLAHPGGPFFALKDNGHWTIPKGQPNAGEDLIDAAQREFYEEVGFCPHGPYISLGKIQQKGGKIVHGWACEGEIPPNHEHRCNDFEMEWPPRSGELQSFPEIDRIAFFCLPEARYKLKQTQVPFLDRLLECLGGRQSG